MSTPDTTPSPADDTPDTSAGPGPGQVSPSAPSRDRFRPGTIVWGLAVAVAGVAIVAWGQGLRFDVQLAAIGVLAAAGVILVATSFARSRNERS